MYHHCLERFLLFHTGSNIVHRLPQSLFILVYPYPINSFSYLPNTLIWIEIMNYFILFRILLLTRRMITQEQKQIKAQKLKLTQAKQEELEVDQAKRNKLHLQRQCSKNLLQVITDTRCSGMNCNRQCLILSGKFNKQYF